jgi:oxygen-independent coproporphyrinogen-3 oxidase
MRPISTELLERFDVPGPRYTSYPTADRFVEAFGCDQYATALKQRQMGFGQSMAPLSLYIHIPFCESLCYYCACNKVITKKYGQALGYLDLLEREIDISTQHLGARQSVSQLHLGGGTPTYLRDEDLSRLMRAVGAAFELTTNCERSIEVDPRTINKQRLEVLKELGFNRLSFGVQDFNEHVQKAVHRVQPFGDVESLMQSSRETGFESINLDLIYGLPLQTPASFSRTLDQLVQLSPERVALYAYAHLPTRFKAQRRISDYQLPSADAKLSMLSLAIEKLLQAGYVYIGMDHFAKPTDSLAVSKRRGTLHRNFQGYSVFPNTDLLGIGVSAISRVGAAYSQNAKSIEDYGNRVMHGQLPVDRGLSLTRDDLLRQTVIMALMCQGLLSFEDIEQAYLIDFKEYFKSELIALAPMHEDGLIVMDGHTIEVTQMGWYFVRAVAMAFDKYLTFDLDRNRFSKII